MRRILVTGANKGIGLAIVEGILAREADTFVYLGSRDLDRGTAARAALIDGKPEWAERVEVLALDVTDDKSVIAAGGRFADTHDKLYALVNNAAIGIGGGTLAEILATNFFGVRRVTDVFHPFLDAHQGRIVNVSSAAGPLFVAECEPKRQREFLNDQITADELEALAAEYLASDAGSRAGYGISKALLNSYTMLLAREHPRLRVNACTPGFIATDLTKPYLSKGQTPEQAGMKTPADGAKTPVELLFADLPGNGRFYGSDGKRSPLDRYRAPGSPEFTG